MLDHVIFISIDTLRSDALDAVSCKLWMKRYNLAPRRISSVLDPLAAQSALFANCITAAPYTAAAHGSYFTGQWPLRHGVYEFFNRPLRSPTIFTRARQLGFRTLFTVDFPIILGSFLGFDRDVDEYLTEDENSFLDKLKKEPRTVSFAHFGGLHVPYGFHNLRIGGPAYRAKVEELEAEVPATDLSLVDRLVETYRDDEDLDLLLRYKRIIQYYYKQKAYEKIFALYIEGAKYFFENRLRPFLDRLLTQLQGSRFLVVLFGDHGEEYSADSCGHFNTVAEGVLRVPVLFYGEDVKPGVYHRRIRSVDVVPSVLELLGDHDHDLDMDGVSLATTLREGSRYEERTAYAQTYVADTQEFVDYQKRLLDAGERVDSLHHWLYREAVYNGPYKLVREHQETPTSVEPGTSQGETENELYRIGPDGHLQEVVEPATVERLGSLLDDYGQLLREEDTEPASVPEDIRKQLQNLGYKV